MSMAAGTVEYTLGTPPVTGCGVSWTAEEMDTALAGPVASVLAVGEAERDRGLKVADARLVKQAVGHQMLIDFPENDFDDELLHRLAMAYEMAAIEGLDAFMNPTSNDEKLRKQCSAGAWLAGPGG